LVHNRQHDRAIEEDLKEWRIAWPTRYCALEVTSLASCLFVTCSIDLVEADD